jgi:hypothetical protein
MSDALVPLMSDALAPFRAVAAGIPDNWPGDAVLTLVQSEASTHLYVGYVPAWMAPGWPTVADRRKLRLRDYDDQVVGEHHDQEDRP